MIPNQNEKPKNPHVPWLFLTLMSAVALLALMFFVDPFKSNVLLIALFYIIAAVLIYSLARFVLGTAHSQAAKRESLLFMILLIGMIFLSSRGLLFWWVGVIYTAAIVLIEAFFLAN